jgi:hypothetical protein
MDLLMLSCVLIGSVAIGVPAVLSINDQAGRMVLGGALVGLLLYSGIGAAYDEVAWFYTAFYFGMFCALALGFFVGRQVLIVRAGKTQSHLGGRVDTDRRWGWVMVAYLALHLWPFLNPEFRLHQLVSPPSPDLKTAFEARFSAGGESSFNQIISYARLLLTPFFYIALFRYRKRITLLSGVLATVIYLQYVEAAYVGRSQILVASLIVLITAWLHKPDARGRTVLIGTAMLLAGLLGSYVYGIVRIGGTVGDVKFPHAALSVLKSETAFPRDVGAKLIDSSARANLAEYVIWAVTLPVPKVVSGPIEGARVNYEISRLVLNRSPGDPGWHIVLPGLVAEGVYLFGKEFFWVHGFLIGMLAAIMVRLLQWAAALRILLIYVAVLFGYVLNRGGIASVLPILVNEFMLLYIFLGVSIMRMTRETRGGGLIRAGAAVRSSVGCPATPQEN